MWIWLVKIYGNTVIELCIWLSVKFAGYDTLIEILEERQAKQGNYYIEKKG